MMDRQKFYGELRRSNAVFGRSLTQAQVDVIEAILDETVSLTNSHVAYVLATAYHESGSPRMVPTVENLHYTTPERIRAVWPSRFKTLASAKPFVRNARGLANQVYNGRLGNRFQSDDGWMYRGRGLDHLTGRDNYERTVPIVRANIVADPDLMLKPAVAVRSLVHGMTTGRYRKSKLSDFDAPTGFDFVAARDIVNADRAKNGALVAGYGRAFLTALDASGRTVGLSGPVRTAEAMQDGDQDGTGGGWLAALIAALTRLLGGRA